MSLAGVSAGVRVEGVKKLRATLKRAGVSMADFTALNRQAAAIVYPVAVGTTPPGPPVNGHIRTTVRMGATRSAAIIRVGNAKFPYAQPIHWGWVRRGIKPNPWVSRAAQTTEPIWTETYFAGLVAIVRTVEGA